MTILFFLRRSKQLISSLLSSTMLDTDSDILAISFTACERARTGSPITFSCRKETLYRVGDFLPGFTSFRILKVFKNGRKRIEIKMLNDV